MHSFLSLQFIDLLGYAQFSVSAVYRSPGLCTVFVFFMQLFGYQPTEADEPDVSLYRDEGNVFAISHRIRAGNVSLDKRRRDSTRAIHYVKPLDSYLITSVKGIVSLWNMKVTMNLIIFLGAAWPSYLVEPMGGDGSQELYMELILTVGAQYDLNLNSESFELEPNTLIIKLSRYDYVVHLISLLGTNGCIWSGKLEVSWDPQTIWFWLGATQVIWSQLYSQILSGVLTDNQHRELLPQLVSDAWAKGNDIIMFYMNGITDGGSVIWSELNLGHLVWSYIQLSDEIPYINSMVHVHIILVSVDVDIYGACPTLTPISMVTYWIHVKLCWQSYTCIKWEFQVFKNVW